MKFCRSATNQRALPSGHDVGGALAWRVPAGALAACACAGVGKGCGMQNAVAGVGTVSWLDQ